MKVKAIYKDPKANPFEGLYGPGQKTITVNIPDDTPWGEVVKSAEEQCDKRKDLQGWELLEVIKL